jgi:hypothetical protein
MEYAIFIFAGTHKVYGYFMILKYEFIFEKQLLLPFKNEAKNKEN